MKFIKSLSLALVITGLFFCSTPPEKPATRQILEDAKALQKQLIKDPISVNMLAIQATIDGLVKTVNELQKYSDYYKDQNEKDHEDASTWRGIKYTFYIICVLGILAGLAGIVIRFSNLLPLKP